MMCKGTKGGQGETYAQKYSAVCNTGRLGESFCDDYSVAVLTCTYSDSCGKKTDGLAPGQSGRALDNRGRQKPTRGNTPIGVGLETKSIDYALPENPWLNAGNYLTNQYVVGNPNFYTVNGNSMTANFLLWSVDVGWDDGLQVSSALQSPGITLSNGAAYGAGYYFSMEFNGDIWDAPAELGGYIYGAAEGPSGNTQYVEYGYFVNTKSTVQVLLAAPAVAAILESWPAALAVGALSGSTP